MSDHERLRLRPHLFESADGSLRVAAEVGRLEVPAQRDQPAAGVIELAVVRLKSRRQPAGPPIIYLAGGPGSSAIQNLRNRLDWFLHLSAEHDLIAFDQRGAGHSQPSLIAPVRWDLPLDALLTRAMLAQTAAERSRTTLAFWQEQGVEMSAYTTVASADDIDDLRRALGAEQIILWGASYGSHLALTTIRRHERHIARAVIALVEGPDHTYKLPSNVQRQLEVLAARVAADPTLGPQAPDLLKLIERILRRLADEPLRISLPTATEGTVNVQIGAFDLQLLTAGSLGDIEAIRRLPAHYLALERGEFDWLAQAVRQFRQSWFPSAMHIVMDLASGATAERLAQIEREREQTLLGDTINLPHPLIADVWGNPDLGDAFRAPIRSAVPALFVSGALDGRTPPSNAEEVRAGFAQSGHIVIDGWAHRSAIDLPDYLARQQAFLRGEPPADAALAAPLHIASL